MVTRREFLAGGLALLSSNMALSSVDIGAGLLKKAVKLRSRTLGDVLPFQREMWTSTQAKGGDYTLGVSVQGQEARYITRLIATNASTEPAIITISSLYENCAMAFPIGAGQSIINEDLGRFERVEGLRVDVSGRKDLVYVVLKAMGSSFPSAGPVQPIIHEKYIMSGGFMMFSPAARTAFNKDLRANLAAYSPDSARVSLNAGWGGVGIKLADLSLSSNVSTLDDYARDNSFGTLTGNPGSRINYPGINVFGVMNGPAVLVNTMMFPGGDGISEPAFLLKGSPRMGVEDLSTNLARSATSIDDIVLTPHRISERRVLNPVLAEPRVLIAGVCDKVNGYDTMIQFFNPGNNFGAVTMRAYTPSGLYPVKLTGILPPGCAVGLADAFQRFGMQAGTYGVLEIECTTGLHARAITYYEHPDGYVSGTHNAIWTNNDFSCGQKLFAPGVANNAGATMNFGLYASPGFHGDVTINVYDGDNSLVGSRDLFLPDGAYVQKNIDYVIGDTELYNGRIEVVPKKLFAFAGWAIRKDEASNKGTDMIMRKKS